MIIRLIDKKQKYTKINQLLFPEEIMTKKYQNYTKGNQVGFWVIGYRRLAYILDNAKK